MKFSYDDEVKSTGKDGAMNAAIVFKRRLWPGAVIPYSFSRTLGKSLRMNFYIYDIF